MTFARFAARMSITQKLLIASMTLLILSGALLASFSYSDQRTNLLAEAQRMQGVTVRVLGTDLAGRFDGFEMRLGADGAIQRVIFPDIPDFTDHGLVDHVRLQTGEASTIFRWEPERGEFLRVTTSITRPDGTRAVGTILDPEGVAKAALLRGETYVGRADILGAPFLTIYVPTHDSAGNLTGSLFAGVALAEVDAVLQAAAVNALLKGTLVLFVAGGLLYLTLRASLAPLVRVNTAMQSIAGGDYTTEVPVPAARDQIGDIARSLIAFRDRLAEAQAERAARQEADEHRAEFFTHVGERVEALSQGRLDARVDGARWPDLDARTRALGDHLNALARSFEELIGQV
ncbi:MAG: Cache 3/Cache 2 fusion domain-containing protein, partial [Alkalilacustris sp.]